MWACTGNASRAPATAAMRHAPFFGDDGVDVADDGVIKIIKYVYIYIHMIWSDTHHHHRRRQQNLHVAKVCMYSDVVKTCT